MAAAAAARELFQRLAQQRRHALPDRAQRQVMILGGILRLADALDVTTDYLLGRVSEAGATATADRLHRDIQKLKATDRSFAEDMIQRMVERATGSKGGKAG